MAPRLWCEVWGLSFLAEKEPRTFRRAGGELERLWSQAAWEPTQVCFLLCDLEQVM